MGIYFNNEPQPKERVYEERLTRKQQACLQIPDFKKFQAQRKDFEFTAGNVEVLSQHMDMHRLQATVAGFLAGWKIVLALREYRDANKA
jgi:hypothetical protein